MKQSLILSFFIGSLFPLLSCGGDLEIPKYQVLKSEESIEIRLYEPMIIAEVKVEGDRDEGSQQAGFRLIADYIFGNNKVKKDIAMTAPVEQQKSQKIAMTAPVEQQSADGLWIIRFVMPSEYNLEDLPKPNNDKVDLKEIEEKKFIVIQFSGRISDKNIKKHEKKLMDYIKENDITAAGSAKYAFYNPPWTLPFLRRNEVMFEIEK